MVPTPVRFKKANGRLWAVDSHKNVTTRMLDAGLNKVPIFISMRNHYLANKYQRITFNSTTN